MIALSPTQRATFDQAMATLRPGSVMTITQGPHNFDHGLGATTIMDAMRRETGGAYIDVRNVLELTRLRHPRYFEQSTFETIRRAAVDSDTLYIDNPPFGPRQAYNRYGMIGTVLRYVEYLAWSEGKRVVFAGTGTASGMRVALPLYRLEDYAHIFAHYLGDEAAARIDMDHVYDHASFFTGHRIVRICADLAMHSITTPTTDDVIAASSRYAGAEIDLAEVEPLSMASLTGFEDIFRRLDRSILLPLREPELAKRMGIKPRRGVLLHGPPGTGKTSIGRALAHQMEGRFFMIDGDYNHEISSSFYEQTSTVFDKAARMTPSVLFIDDADVILSDPAMQHWGRFLLTKLDGLHSRAAGKVCVMMTAMNIHDLPPALLRSGRLDLWIETHLPDGVARAEILAGHLAKLPFTDSIDPMLAADLTDGFTPADLRSVITDIASYVALDRVRGLPARPLTEHFRRAALDKQNYRAAAARFKPAYAS